MINNNMKILFITSDTSDYQSDSLFHGLRSLYGSQVVDFPKAERMYKFDLENINVLHGLGFTCYGLLENIKVDRNNIYEKVKNNYFDLIIFSSIHRQFGFFIQCYPWLSFENTLIIDGEDTPSLYKYCGNFWRHISWYFLPKAHTNFLYFKRELNIDTLDYLYYLLLPKFLLSKLNFPKNIRRINFSIPEEKIKVGVKKIKLFGRHIVDPEVAANVEGSSTGYVFDNEGDYYYDLQISKFAITTKRAGWDCIRHYEIAANGAVMCFKDLDLKHNMCAPHGLDSTNCVIYKDYNDLITKVYSISDEEYLSLQYNSIKWVNNNTTKAIANNILNQFLG